MIVRSLVAVVLLLAAPAEAGGLGSMLGGGLPWIGNAGVGNVAGLLGYCVKNKLTGGAGAQSVLGKLTGQPAVTQSPGYSQGLLGNVLGGGRAATATSATPAKPTLSLDSLQGKLKTRACDMVLQRAGSFL